MKMFICYLDAKETIDSSMSTSQVFRKVIYSLSTMDWTSEGIFCGDDAGKCQLKSDWHEQFEVVFVDKSGTMNYAADMNKATYLRAQWEARLTLDMMNEDENHHFNSLFVIKVDFFANFDHIVL